MKVIIVEDEKPAADHLRWMLSNIDPKIEVLQQIDTVRAAIVQLPETQADLIFLDIYLADDICFKIFDQITIHTPVIFTTAYDQYAIKAFRLNSIDYLLKPVQQDRLAEAIEKYRTLNQKNTEINSLYQQLLATLSEKKEPKKRLMVEAGRQIKTIKTSNIAYFFSEDKNIFLTTFQNRTYPTDSVLDKLENVLDPAVFFRVNRQFIIHIDAITQIHYRSSSKIKLALKPEPRQEIIVSTRRLKAFKNWLEQ